MPSLATLLRSFGNDQAVANVRTVLEQRHREEWIVAGLCHRLDDRAGALAAPDVRQGLGGSRSHAAA